MSSSPWAIELEGVTKRLRGRNVLDSMTLRIPKGETFVIIGPSGTGKSVTLKHMIGLMVPDAGRILALTLVCPLLTLFTNLLGIAGGSVIASTQFGVTFHEYYDKALDILELKDLYSGLFKAMVFGTTIATVGCTMGMRTTGGSMGVGRATLNSVVISLLLILILGFFMTSFFYVR